MTTEDMNRLDAIIEAVKGKKLDEAVKTLIETLDNSTSPRDCKLYGMVASIFNASSVSISGKFYPAILAAECLLRLMEMEKRGVLVE